MTYFTACPIPNPGGKDCWSEPHPANSFGICLEHWRKVVDQWHEDIPGVHVQCIHCSHLSLVDAVELDSAVCQRCHERVKDPDLFRQMHEAAQEAQAAMLNRTPALGVVYYMRFSDRVKIGFTTNLKNRADAVPNDEVVAAEPGTYALEAQRHIEFTAERLDDRGEWFNLSPRLAFHMANVRDANGDPFVLSEKRRLHG